MVQIFAMNMAGIAGASSLAAHNLFLAAVFKQGIWVNSFLFSSLSPFFPVLSIHMRWTTDSLILLAYGAS